MDRLDHQTADRPPWHRGRLVALVKLLLLLALLAWLGTESAARTGYNWQWYRLPRYFFTVADGHWAAGPLLEGLGVTLKIVGVSLPLAFLFGLAAALLRLCDSLVGRVLARVYLEAIRNTPLLIQIFFLYFVVAPLLDIGRLPAAILALSLFEGAYAAEILRAGILAVPRGQWEASASLGLSRPTGFRLVILPQTLRLVLPPLTSQAISLVKDSALVSTIAIFDLTMQGQAIVAETYLTFEVWFGVAALYLAINLLLSALVRLLENRLIPAGAT